MKSGGDQTELWSLPWAWVPAHPSVSWIADDRAHSEHRGATLPSSYL